MFPILVAIYLLFSVGGMALFKCFSSGSQYGMQDGFFKLSIHPLVIIGVLCYMISFFLWLMLISQSDLSKFLPIVSGLGTVIACVVGVLLFHETLNLQKIIGIILIVSGVILVSFLEQKITP